MKILKKVVGIGNGAAVYIPKEYKGKEVVVILLEEIDEIRKRVLSRLVDFMPNICGVYLYGSYARGEQEVDSDIDILIIVEKKDEKIKRLFDDIDTRVLTLENIKKAIKNFPALVVPLLREAKVFLNPILLEELKKEKINFRKFYWNFADHKRIIEISKFFIKMGKNFEILVYSLMMRLRICYMIENLLENKIFSNIGVKKTLMGYGMREEEYERLYKIYKQIRENKKVMIKIEEKEIWLLVDILEKYTKNLKNETKKKIEEGN